MLAGIDRFVKKPKKNCNKYCIVSMHPLRHCKTIVNRKVNAATLVGAKKKSACLT